MLNFSAQKFLSRNVFQTEKNDQKQIVIIEIITKSFQLSSNCERLTNQRDHLYFQTRTAPLIQLTLIRNHSFDQQREVKKVYFETLDFENTAVLHMCQDTHAIIINRKCNICCHFCKLIIAMPICELPSDSEIWCLFI